MIKQILLLPLLLFSFCVTAQEGMKERLKEDVSFLASDKLKGRETGSKSELKAAKYIEKRFEEIGLTTILSNGTYLQEFEIKTATSKEDEKEEKQPLIAHNVIGYIDNGGRSTIVIGAHYDHLGFGDEGSRHTGKRAVHNGADDNASGVGAVIAIASELKQRSDLNNNFLFIAFSGEEKGLLGSKYYVKNPVIPNKTINFMLNLDMVGRLSTQEALIVSGTGTSVKWDNILDKVALEGKPIKKEKSGLGRSDHTSFYLSEIPVLSIYTGAHGDYHKPSDDVDKIDFDGISKIVNYSLGIIYEVDKVIKLAYSRTENEADRNAWANPTKSRKKYKVTLGVMPDYAFEGEGMRIDGVLDGRPAQKAGMQDGDVVTKLGDVEVTDLTTYMTALGQFDSGDRTTVQFTRDGKKMELPLEF